MDKEAKKNMGLDSGFMTRETFLLLCDQLAEYPETLKEISFCGLGDQLLHKDLPWMIRTLRERNLVRIITLITNGVALTHAMTDELSVAGIDNIKFSINGLSDEDYKKYTGVKIDFTKLVENIDYFYKSKSENTQVFCRLPEYVLDGKDKQMFYDIFSDKCDYIAIHTISKWFSGVSYDQLPTTDFASPYLDSTHTARICSVPFFRLNLLWDGGTILCGCRDDNITYGENIHNKSLLEIWNGELRKSLLIAQLTGNITAWEGCKVCQQRYHVATDADNLDPYADELIDRIKNS
jgi:hypothetical protein